MKSRLLILSIVVILILFSMGPVNAENVKMLLVLSHHYGANYYLNLDNFEKFGFDITTTATTLTVNACGAFAAPLGCPVVTVDILVTDITDITEYDCIAIMSASDAVSTAPHSDLLNCQYALDLINTANSEGIVLAAMCTGVRVLAAADVIEGVNVTGSQSYAYEYYYAGATYLGAQLPPVIDGNIVTCTRGMYFNNKNCNAVLTALENLQNQIAEGGE